jgi:hypothetical protein
MASLLRQDWRELSATLQVRAPAATCIVVVAVSQSWTVFVRFNTVRLNGRQQITQRAHNLRSELAGRQITVKFDS